MKSLYFLTILTIFLFHGCNSPVLETNELKSLKIDFDKELSSVHLLELVDPEIEIIPLSNYENDSSIVYLKEIDRIYQHQDKFYIFDMVSGGKVMVFDQTGSFIRSIGHRGEGPGGLIQPMDFRLEGDEILVLDFGKVLTFDLEGNFIESQKLNSFSGHKFAKTDKGYAFIGAGRDTDNLLLTDDQFRLDTSYFPYHTRALNPILLNSLYVNPEGKLIYRRNYHDTLYQVQDLFKPVPYLYIDFSEHKSNIQSLLSSPDLENLLLAKGSKSCNILYFYETEKYQYLAFTLRNEKWIYIHSNKSDKSVLLKNSNLIDEVTYNPSSYPIGVVGDRFIFRGSPAKILEILEEENEDLFFYQKFLALKNNFDREGNPVLFLIKFDF